LKALPNYTIFPQKNQYGNWEKKVKKLKTNQRKAFGSPRERIGRRIFLKGSQKNNDFLPFLRIFLDRTAFLYYNRW
jgi:hypothetical protein